MNCTTIDEGQPTQASVRDVALALLAARGGGATICPSEVARAIAVGSGATGWRDLMPRVHKAVDRMATEGEVEITWQGSPRAVGDGPYRIGRTRKSGSGK